MRTITIGGWKVVVLSIDSKSEFHRFSGLLEKREPFVFVRFSDGELEILRNHSLIINSEGVSWSKGTSKHRYPDFDFKTFIPEIHQNFRNDLMSSAMKKSEHFYKGIPTRHNGSYVDRDWMIELNQNSTFNLTFSDLFLNSNFIKFRKQIVPKFQLFDYVYVLGNFRMNPGSISKQWKLIEIPDNFILDYDNVRDEVLSQIQNVEEGALILSSASSLSNVIGAEVVDVRPDLTFIDVGTSMHDLMGMTDGIREYHSLLKSWSLKSFRSKLGYFLSRSHRIRW